jgi:hypothetical protein
MRKRIITMFGFAAFAMFATVTTANAASIYVPPKPECVPLTIECANPFCAKSAGPKCCLRWACGRAPNRSSGPAKKS